MSRPTRRHTLAAACLLAAAPLTVVGVADAAPQPITPIEWTRTVLSTDVVDPTDLDVAPDGAVVIAERTGAIKVWKQDGTLKTAGTIPVSANVSLTEPGEELEEGGIHGLLLDRSFLKTRKVFVHYSVPGSLNEKTGDGVFRTSSFILDRNYVLQRKTEKKVIEVPAEWANCCHYGGDLEWMKDGTILLTVGDDTSPRDEGWAPRDKRKGREAFNAERTSQNKKDRRGKVLRFNPDGTVPANNPHVRDKSYDPYVYAMGFRSDYRMGHDQVTGATFVGNVGPDSRNADATRGPQGFDELETVPPKGGTNHGWPRCIADNKPYVDYDYATGASKGPLSCKGMTPATLFYDYNYSAEFPLVATGTRTQMSGPVYRSAGKGALALPVSFQDKLIHWDWSRGLMFATPVRADGTLDTASLTPWSAATPNTFVSAGGAVPVGGPAAPMEMVAGPDGALYVAEYGSGYYNNTNSAITRISCFQCTPSAKDYAGSPVVKPDAGVEQRPVLPAAGTVSANGVSAPTAVVPATGGVLAATGGALPLAGAGLLVVLAAVLLRRRSPGAVDASGL
jgi:glucose/arabinose dehydrogenase